MAKAVEAASDKMGGIFRRAFPSPFSLFVPEFYRKKPLAQSESIIAVLPGLSHTVFPEFQAYCGAFSHAAYKDSPLGPLPAEIGSERIKTMTQLISRKRTLALVGAATLLAVWAVAGGMVATAQAEVRHSVQGDLFYNFYVPPVGDQSVGAEMYLCPRPTPPLVGHTYISYQPLLPHEMMYPHHRVYKTYHDDAPPTKTRVHWNHRCYWLCP
jgi:hypothetical protein